MGKYVESPNIKVDWDAFAEHGWERMSKRNVTQDMVNSWVQNGKALSQNGGSKFAYITKEGVAVVSKEGKLITTWGADNFDDAMKGIVEQLYGKQVYMIANVINEWDPIDLFPYVPSDEYEEEIKLLGDFLSMRNEVSEMELTDEIQRIFVKRFGNDVFTKDKSECAIVARRILTELNG